MRVLRRIALLVVGAALAFAGMWVWRQGPVAEGSAVSALSARVLAALPKYYAAHGRYPSSLAALSVEANAVDWCGRTLARQVRYSSDGASFTYAEIGPDEWHRRVWWCHGARTCYVADLK